VYLVVVRAQDGCSGLLATTPVTVTVPRGVTVFDVTWAQQQATSARNYWIANGMAPAGFGSILAPTPVP
jgi:hypothetical protein